MSTPAAHADTHIHDTPHTHIVVPPITLTAILGLLLVFTVLTVGIAQFELWIMDYFQIQLPHWVNIAGAMAIAAVKAALVMAFFMQLKYDNPMNSVAMFLCFIAVGFFLFFTSLDLFTRDRIYDFKSAQVVPGGTGVVGKPLVDAARDRGIEAWGAARYNQIEAVLHHGKHHGPVAAPKFSTAQQTRPLAGLTGALGAAASSDAEGHDGHAQPAAHTPAH
jgi:caa(3)-type oxidase subunit IV